MKDNIALKIKPRYRYTLKPTQIINNIYIILPYLSNQNLNADLKLFKRQSLQYAIKPDCVENEVDVFIVLNQNCRTL